jgi:deoxycytidylate deaminase
MEFGFKCAKIGFKRSTHRRPMGAAYIEGSRIVIASNENKTHPLSKRYNSRFSCLHAEHNCLRGIRDASKGKLFIYRETKDGKTAMGRPCEGCLKLLRDKKVKRVYYTIVDNFVKEILL